MIKTFKIKVEKHNKNEKETTMNKTIGLMLITSMIVFSGSVLAVDYDIIPDEITVTDEEYNQLAEALGFDTEALGFEEEPIAPAAGFKSYHKMGNKTTKIFI